MDRLEARKVNVPTHSAYVAPLPKLDRAKEYHRAKKLQQIELENQHIMSKLVGIN